MRAYKIVIPTFWLLNFHQLKKNIINESFNSHAVGRDSQKFQKSRSSKKNKIPTALGFIFLHDVLHWGKNRHVQQLH